MIILHVSDPETHALLRLIYEQGRPRLSATLKLKNKRGHTMAGLRVGQSFTATWQEFSGPNGTGDPLPPAGAVVFTSSDPSVATVDPNSGVGVAVSAGSVTITGNDATDNLTASDSATVAAVAQSATLTIIPN